MIHTSKVKPEDVSVVRKDDGTAIVTITTNMQERQQQGENVYEYDTMSMETEWTDGLFERVQRNMETWTQEVQGAQPPPEGAAAASSAAVNASPKKTDLGFVKHVLNWVGMPYWYGTCCYDCTESLLSRKREQYPSHYSASRMPRYRSDIARKLKCADCIGLAKGFMWLDEATGKQKYGANGCPDKSANGMYEYAKSSGLDYGPISTMPELRGIMLWRAGHAGVYIGEGMEIEARGFAYGVVKRKVSDAGFTNWYKLPGLTYTQTPDDRPASDWPLLGSRLLRKDSTGDDVAEMQKRLNSISYDCGKVDGIFGSNTLAGVKAFQRDHALVVDGIYGPKTHAALNEALLDPTDTDTDGTGEDGARKIVTAGTAKLYAGPGTKYEIVSTAAKGQELIQPVMDGWLPVRFSETIAWVKTTQVRDK